MGISRLCSHAKLNRYTENVVHIVIVVVVAVTILRICMHLFLHLQATAISTTTSE